MILQLRFFDGLTQSQIAQQVGISQMHVSRLIRRSLEKIRDEIASDDDPARPRAPVCSAAPVTKRCDYPRKGPGPCLGKARSETDCFLPGDASWGPGPVTEMSQTSHKVCTSRATRSRSSSSRVVSAYMFDESSTTAMSETPPRVADATRHGPALCV